MIVERGKGGAWFGLCKQTHINFCTCATEKEPQVSYNIIDAVFFFAEECSTKWQSHSASPIPHPSKPHPCNMPQAKTEVALQFSECYATEVALQHSLFCSAEVVFTKSCAAASEKLQCNIEKAALQESGVFLPLSCGFQAPTFRHPRLGPADPCGSPLSRYML